MPDKDGFTKVNVDIQNSPFWKPEEVNDEVRGSYVDMRQGVGQYNQTVYTIQKEDGSHITVSGNAGIDRAMVKIPLGSEVKIVYLGRETNPKTKREFKKFDIFSKQIKPSSMPTESSDEVAPDDIPF